MTDIDMVPLPGLLPEFAHEGWSIPPGVNYHTVYKMVIGGRLPAHKHGGRYSVDRADKPAYAKALGLTPPAPAKSARKAASTLVAA